MAWNYSNTHLKTTLTASISPSATTISVASATGLPVSFPFSLVIDFEQPSVEVVTVTGLAGTNLTVVRGEDGTAAQAHDLGAVVVHGVVARDVREPQTHIAATGDIHGVGVGNAVVGTGTPQALTNKTISGSANTLSNVPDSALVAISASKVTQPFPTLESNGQLTVTRPTVADHAYRSKVTGDLDHRLVARADGMLSWGSGAATGDTNLYRSAADMLTTDDEIKSLRSTVGSGAFSASVTGDGIMRHLVFADGKHEWGPGNAGRDTNLYRSAANVLKTDDTLDVVGNIQLASTSDIVWAGDTILYRSAANILKTDDDFHASGLLLSGSAQVNGNLTVAGIGSRVTKRKTADENVANSTVAQNDAHLFWSVVANATYTVELTLFYQGAEGTNVGELGAGWTFPAGSTLTWGVNAPAWYNNALSGDGNWQSQVGNTTSPTGLGALLGTSSIGPQMGIVRALLRTGGTAGTLQFQWAQWQANATPTIIYADSFGVLERVA